MIVRHVIEHSYDLTNFISAIKTLVRPDGFIVWELPDCQDALKNGDCTTIWEEHIHYFTSTTFKLLIQNSSFEILYFDSVNYPLENSIVAIVKKNKSKLIHISTDEVYGDIFRGRSNEKYAYQPSSPYAATKAASDHLVSSYVRTYNLPVGAHLMVEDGDKVENGKILV